METDENSDSDGADDADGLFNLRRVWVIGGFLPADCQCVSYPKTVGLYRHKISDRNSDSVGEAD